MKNPIPITILMLVLWNNVFCQPGTDVEELNRKHHHIDGMTYGHPYTTFDRHNGLSIDSTIILIRKRIIEESSNTGKKPIFLAYKEVYDNAISNMPTDNGMPDEAVSDLAVWAKNNAFVFLIGLDGDAKWMDTTSYEGVKSFAKRDGFRDRVYDPSNTNNAFDHLTGEMYTLPGDLQFGSRSLIFWLQAYDLLKASYEVYELKKYGRNYYGFGNIDRNKGKWTPRNKLRKLTRDLYQESKGVSGVVEHVTGWEKNHGIASASAILLAAQVLNDAGVENEFFNTWYSYIPIIGQIIRLIAEPWPHPNYSPINWNKLGYDGLDDNLFHGKHWPGFEDVPQSPVNNENNSYSVYAEGIAYVGYGFLDCGLPAFRAQKNLYPDYSGNPFIKKNEILNIINWIDRLRVDSVNLPTFDNSGQTDAAILALVGDERYNYGYLGASLGKYLVDYVAMVGGNNLGFNSELPRNFDAMENAGNIIIRNNNKFSNQTFLMLCEKGIAVDVEASSYDESHDDPDMGSWSLFVQDKLSSKTWQLAVDPPYGGWGHRDGTNKFDMHNVIQIHTLNSPNYDEYKYPKFNRKISAVDGISEFELVYDWKEDKNSELIGNAISRNVFSYNLDGEIYYILNDYINANDIEDFSKTTFIINGNGNFDNNTYHKTGNIHIWDYPCSNSSNWVLTTHHASLKGGLTSSQYEEKPLTKNEWTFAGSAANEISGGYLTRLKINQTTSKTIYQSFIYPKICNAKLPTILKFDTGNFVGTTIYFISGKDTSFEARLGKNNSNNLVNDISCHLHLTRWDGNISDSLINPFHLPNQTNQKLYFNAQKAFLNYHTLSYLGAGYKYCPPSYSNFKILNFTNGSYLIYKDTLVYSDIPINLDFAISGFQKYQCKINTLVSVSGSDTIKLKLPDVNRGVDMMALKSQYDTIKSRYDSLTNYIYLALSSVPLTEFIISEKQKCHECFFPLPGAHIDTLFEDDDGQRHTLGHSMNINYPHGNLYISKSSIFDMCAGVYLLNKDSLIIEGPPQSRGMVVPSCSGIDSIAKASDNSMLIVSPGSALILDAGSRTYVNNGGAIYVAQNGSLVIKDGAFLQIGDSGSSGWGEIIAEHGAYIYIEPDAHIEYRRTIGDTADRNIFSIAVGNYPAYAGVYFFMDSILKAEGIIASTIFPIAICDLDSLYPIANREWGYTNFGMPKATIQTENDTICPGTPLYIKMNRILNDASAQITVCRWDSIFDTDRKFIRMECVNDSIVLDSLPPDPVCRLPRILPDEWTYYFNVNTRHQVSITVYNECGRRHDTSILIVVLDTPQFTLSVPATACEGYQTVKVLASSNIQDSVLYAYDITELVDTNSIAYQIGNPGQEYSYSHFGILPDTFDFPGYYFRGGRSYLISLSLTNDCGTKTVYGEVNIPGGAYIKLERPNAYANPVNGAMNVKLHGYISAYDSFCWEPTTWLDSPTSITPISTPLDSITYVLIAYKDACIATDTTYIKYNRHANAGMNDTLCYDSNYASTETLLGFPYDMSLFLGILYYYNPSEFMGYYNTHNAGNNPAYFRYFTHYMHGAMFNEMSSSCPLDLFNLFTNELNKEAFFRESWFKSYYQSFTEFDDNNLTSMADFVSGVNGNSSLGDELDEMGEWSTVEPCLEQILLEYDNFLAENVNDISASWTRITDEDTTVLNSWDNYFVATDEPTQSATYVLSVITSGQAEFDEITILLDTILVPNFAPEMQFDSTVYFMNFTNPLNPSNTY